MNKEIKTILFASLIAAMILPFSGMQFTVAEEQADLSEYYEYPPTFEFETTDHTNDLELLKSNVDELKEKIENTQDKEKLQNLEKRLDRAILMYKIAVHEVKAEEHPNKAEFHYEKVGELMNELNESYDKSEKFTMTENNTPFPNTSGLWIDYPELDFKTTTEYRYHCIAKSNLPGFVDGTVDPMWPYTSYWDLTWHYPNTVTGYGGECVSEEHIKSEVIIWAETGKCNIETDGFSLDDAWCPLIHKGDKVIIYAESWYDRPDSTYNQSYSASTVWKALELPSFR